MSAIQLSFKMRTSSGVKTVHLVGSWDNYTGQLPLASTSSSSSSSSKKSSSSSSSSSSWKGTFRFHAHGLLQPGQRYWYYYILDGHHVSHDPAEAHVVEPTTGRKLNILDVAADTSSTSSSSSSSRSRSSKHSTSSTSTSSSTATRHNLSLDIPKGRPLSISQIKSPKPISPGAANFILAHGDATAPAATFGYDNYTYDNLADQFAQTSLHAADLDVDPDAYYTSTSSSSSISSSPSSSFSSSSSLASSMSDYSSSSSGASSPISSSSSSRHSRRHLPACTCTCERYGITRQGSRIRLDCGGSRCAGLSYSSSSSSSGFSSSDECCEEDEEEEVVVKKSSRHASSREKTDGKKTKDKDGKVKESRHHHHRQRA